MAERSWTPAQADAIHARGGTLLVSAAAGSGKTAVLVQRGIERITDEQHPSDADRLLVVTFTKAAAAEMRERIAQQLSRMLAEDPSNTALQRQQILLGGAHISTVHSFCSELVRENFYKLNISHDFRIADEGEMSILRGEAITQVLEDYYAAANPDFYELVEAFSSDRDDSRLIRAVNQLYDFIRSHPFPERWLREKAEMYSGSVPVQDTPWGACLLSFAQEACDYCLSLVRDSLESMQGDEKLCTAYTEAYQSDLSGLSALHRAAQQREWDNVGELAANFAFARLKPVRGYAEDPLKLRLSACRDEVKSTVKKLAALFSATLQDCADDLRALSPVVEQLFAVVTAFSRALDQMKAERRLADFGDLEHWALRLLVRETENGYERTEEALELSRRFDEIMVDEYQDTNEAQDLLFRAISQKEENLFMVGDVKQSIYSFRQAMPRIFL
ncbi:UvrD-helicase domain-containing protein, partial [Faecalispora jeddahensis]|uniref:UvrD-helicase domain-containing protein n=1 Tax=Faecalispora jeddahensis TaxID=1414721 RepID=UPI0028ACBA20